MGSEILKSAGIEFEEQVLLFGRFTVDVFMSNENIAIQWDGDFWHGHPKKYRILNSIQISNRKNDRACNAYLRKCGVRVLRFWESEIKTNPDIVLSKIKSTMKS
jgi:very-short-patch-repair endonuclease